MFRHVKNFGAAVGDSKAKCSRENLVVRFKNCNPDMIRFHSKVMNFYDS